MYQFYYSEANSHKTKPIYEKKMKDEIEIYSIMPTMWEEHCLECSAPLCYKECNIYLKRKDGRCKRFFDGINIYEEQNACCGIGARIKFRQWANMMTILFPNMLNEKEYIRLNNRNLKLGNRLKKVLNGLLPTTFRWQYVRVHEALRRRFLRKLRKAEQDFNFFVFHGYSFWNEPFHLIVEIYQSTTPVGKTSILINPGENLYTLNVANIFPFELKKGYIIKVYPENNIEAEVDLLWCDFVKGKIKKKVASAEKVKCVVWDLDNTLWDATLIETENVDSIKLKEGVLSLIKALDERGIIQSISSKNEYENAWSVLEQLGVSEYFLYPQINWGPKSVSIEKIARSLNIGIDSFAFIDDSIFEREQVRSVLPQVRVYDENCINNILCNAEFSVLVTEESRQRRKMYKAEECRNQIIEARNMDITDFIRSCNLSIVVFTPHSDEEVQRCYELVVRTNQLNMSGIKYSREQFQEVVCRPERKNFAFSSKDDFGSYGIVGFGQYFIRDETVIFCEFAMSCRVAGKFIESSLFYNLLKNESCRKGLFSIKKTKKNGLLIQTLKSVGFSILFESEDLIELEFTEKLLNKELVKCSYSL